MKILGERVLVSKIEDEEKDGFKTVDVIDSFIFKGKVEAVGWEDSPNVSGDIFNYSIKVGDIVIFAKYSPDTNDVEHEGKRYKIVNAKDILAVL